MRPPRVPRSPLFATPSLAAFVATLTGLMTVLLVLRSSPVALRRAVVGRTQCECSIPLHSESAPEIFTPGKYRLTLIAGRGSRVGARATGTLTLFPTSGADRSPTTPNGRAGADTAAYPMYGATNLDLTRVGAPLMPDVFFPAPTSLDPLRPGVLVHVDYAHGRADASSIELLIGTRENLRDNHGFVMTDGAGIVLSVCRIIRGRVVGEWRNYGMVVNGSGEFYIVPFDGDRLDIIERRLAPPSRAAPTLPRTPDAETVPSSPARASRPGPIASAVRSRSSRETATRLTVRR